MKTTRSRCGPSSSAPSGSSSTRARLPPQQPVGAGFRAGGPSRSRNADNADVLREAYEAISEAVKAKRLITPAADWLVNNFHIVEDQLRDIRTLLPKRFFARLPALDAGPLAGLPRIYGMAWAFVAHTDSRFDPDLLLRFVAAYQQVHPLELAELWALPTVLRIVMIENARRLAVRIVASMKGREQADRYADSLTGLATDVVDDVSLVAAGTSTGWSRAFTVQLFQRLRHRDATAAVALQELVAAARRRGNQRGGRGADGDRAPGRSRSFGAQPDHQHAPACRRTNGRTSSKRRASCTRRSAAIRCLRGWISSRATAIGGAVEDLVASLAAYGARRRERRRSRRRGSART